MKFIYKYTRVLTSYYIIQQQQQWMQHANETFIYCIREQQQQQILNQTFKTHSNGLRYIERFSKNSKLWKWQPKINHQTSCVKFINQVLF